MFIFYLAHLCCDVKYFLCRITKHSLIRFRMNAWYRTSVIIKFIELFISFSSNAYLLNRSLLFVVLLNNFNSLIRNNSFVFYFSFQLTRFPCFIMLYLIFFENRVLFYFPRTVTSITETPFFHTLFTILRFIKFTSNISSQ